MTDLLTDHGTTADGLLLAMPALWEAVVRRLGTEAAGPQGGHAVPGGSGAGITIRGDLGNARPSGPICCSAFHDFPDTTRHIARCCPWTPSTSATTATA